MKIIVMSCDKYKVCWKPFFTLLNKYWKNHPTALLVCETEFCPYCETINIPSNSWTKRLREALKGIKDEEVLLMLDDFFIRRPVDVDRINKIKLSDETICYNFEKNYREPALKLKEWDIQKNNQVYLNSCQPSIWNREKLIERLQEDKNPQEWETTKIDSPYIHFINNQDYIIDIGYRHQPLNIGWGITRGKLTEECKAFLESEALLEEIIDYNTLL